MATFAEIDELITTGALSDKVRVAISILAYEVLTEDPLTPNHAERYKWAAMAFSNPSELTSKFLTGVLAANSGLSVAQIVGATDSAVKSKCAELIDVFALAEFGV